VTSAFTVLTFTVLRGVGRHDRPLSIHQVRTLTKDTSERSSKVASTSEL
jgi:hypothetical protein